MSFYISVGGDLHLCKNSKFEQLSPNTCWIRPTRIFFSKFLHIGHVIELSTLSFPKNSHTFFLLFLSPATPNDPFLWRYRLCMLSLFLSIDSEVFVSAPIGLRTFHLWLRQLSLIVINESRTWSSDVSFLLVVVLIRVYILDMWIKSCDVCIQPATVHYWSILWAFIRK